MTTKVDIEKLKIKNDQHTVILTDGTEWRRDGFCQLSSGDKDSTEKNKKKMSNPKDTPLIDAQSTRSKSA